jgi:selenophosphate synthase
MARTGFLMLHVDDPFDFGRITANHATGEVGAMRGRPILALVAD